MGSIWSRFIVLLVIILFKYVKLRTLYSSIPNQVSHSRRVSFGGIYKKKHCGHGFQFYLFRVICCFVHLFCLLKANAIGTSLMITSCTGYSYLQIKRTMKV